MSGTAKIFALGDAFPAVAAWLDGQVEALPPRTEADEIAEAFCLDAFGRNLLLLCAFAALEPEGQAAVAKLNENPLMPHPSVGLALLAVPGASWRALSAEAPLRAQGIITAEDGPAPFAARSIRMAEPVLFRLLGAPALGPDTAPYLTKLQPSHVMPANRQRLAGQIEQRLFLPNIPVLHLSGADEAGKCASFAAACASQGITAYGLVSVNLPLTAAELRGLAQDIARDLTLTDGRLALIVDPASEERLARAFIDLYPAPLAVVATEPPRNGRRRAVRLDSELPSSAEQQDVWDMALGGMGKHLNGSLSRMAATFRVPPEAAEAVAAELLATVPMPKRKRKMEEPELARAAWDACRRAARPRMDDLAERVKTSAVWDDLILPPRQKDTLATILANVRNRTQVYEDWGFSSRLQEKGLGVSALFSGPSGAGKSMAGEVLGAELELDIYRVDLSALVSKWVGETEKNLRRVFDAAEEGGVILQFDEADALFGKRSEVRDSHDRHANIEVSYLLQRLEAYRGLCILTTNMRDNIDDAFLRRIRFILEFRFPNPRERRAIWERAFPKAVPRDGLDLDRLAQLNVAGGSIRNIALSAAFLAADRQQPVTMAGILQAARTELEKSGRDLTEIECAGWPQ